MEGAPRVKELNLLTDVVYCFIYGLFLFVLSYPLFLGVYIAIQSFGVPWMFGSAISLPLIILSFAPMSLIAGAVNTITTRYLWSYRSRSSVKVWIEQGLFIVVIIQLFLIPLPAIQTALTRIPLWIQPVFLVVVYADYWILFGFIGRLVARRYIDPFASRPRVIRDEKSPSFAGTRARCPRCQTSHNYRDDEIANDGTVMCLSCNRPFYIEAIGILMDKIGENRDADSRIDL